MAMSRRVAAMFWLVAVLATAVAGGVGAETAGKIGAELGCFCDCMKNRCMTLGTADKFDCAGACTEGCTQIGKPGQPKDDEFCGF